MAERQKAPITVEEFERMITDGLLTKDDHVELIEGEIVEMEPIGAAHAGCIDVLNELLTARLAGRAWVRVQSSIQLAPGTMPQPDLALLSRHARDYRRERPRAEDVLLLVEVCDTSLMRDLDDKLPRYAAAGIPEAWLVDLPGQRLLRLRAPEGVSYRRADVLARGDALAPDACPEAVVTLDEILGPPDAGPESAGG